MLCCPPPAALRSRPCQSLTLRACPPTEQCFNQIKKFVQREGSLYEADPELAFHHACQEVTPQQGRNYFRAAGYKVEAELTEEDIEMVVAVQLAMQA